MSLMTLLLFLTSPSIVTTTPEAETTPEEDTYAAEAPATERPYVFSWMDYPRPTVGLRGGTTTGIPVNLVTESSDSWIELQSTESTGPQKDAAAITAMAGDYRAFFDFLEIEVYGEETEPARPYRSWGTERVYLLEHSDTFVQLQHILVMFMVGEDGETQGPFVMKHWRQDWEYEPESILEFTGNRTWERRALDEEERAGQWVQTVYQVDDSPRYALMGEWEHTASYSRWDSTSGWRPLPRREYSVRSDYQALVGTNTITIFPRGWVHSQDNIKTVLTDTGEIDTRAPAVARELGVNRYDRILDFDFSAGDAYWEDTQRYWSAVRDGWTARLSESAPVHIGTSCADQPLFMLLFGTAQEIHDGNRYRPRVHDPSIDEALDCVVNAPSDSVE